MQTNVFQLPEHRAQVKIRMSFLQCLRTMSLNYRLYTPWADLLVPASVLYYMVKNNKTQDDLFAMENTLRDLRNQMSRSESRVHEAELRVREIKSRMDLSEDKLRKVEH